MGRTFFQLGTETPVLPPGRGEGGCRASQTSSQPAPFLRSVTPRWGGGQPPVPLGPDEGRIIIFVDPCFLVTQDPPRGALDPPLGGSRPEPPRLKRSPGLRLVFPSFRRALPIPLSVSTRGYGSSGSLRGTDRSGSPVLPHTFKNRSTIPLLPLSKEDLGRPLIRFPVSSQNPSIPSTGLEKSNP